jgi:hypothetical protein
LNHTRLNEERTLTEGQVDPEQLKKLLINLMKNACEAMEGLAPKRMRGLLPPPTGIWKQPFPKADFVKTYTAASRSSPSRSCRNISWLDPPRASAWINPELQKRRFWPSMTIHSLAGAGDGQRSPQSYDIQ